MFYHRICNLKMPSLMGEISDQSSVKISSEIHYKIGCSSSVFSEYNRSISARLSIVNPFLVITEQSLLSIVSSVPVYITVSRYRNLISLNQCLPIFTSSHILQTGIVFVQTIHFDFQSEISILGSLNPKSGCQPTLASELLELLTPKRNFI